MKKTYKNPTLTVVKIQTSNLLQAVSGKFGDGFKDGGSAAGRGASFSDWGEEE